MKCALSYTNGSENEAVECAYKDQQNVHRSISLFPYFVDTLKLAGTTVEQIFMLQSNGSLVAKLSPKIQVDVLQMEQSRIEILLGKIFVTI